MYLSVTPWTAAWQTSLSFMSPGVCSDSCPLRGWCYLTISSSAVFSFFIQSLPHPGFFPVSLFFASGGQNVRTSASASVLPMKIQLFSSRIDWFDFLAVQETLKSLLQHHNSKVSILQCSAFFMVQFSHLYMTARKPQLWLYSPLLARWCLCFLICCLCLLWRIVMQNTFPRGESKIQFNCNRVSEKVNHIGIVIKVENINRMISWAFLPILHSFIPSLIHSVLAVCSVLQRQPPY